MDFAELAILTTLLDAPAIADNEDGEIVIVYPANKTGDCIRVDTFQENGWVRQNYYWSDGTVEEMYERA